jgi:hypothetical protein
MFGVPTAALSGALRGRLGRQVVVDAEESAPTSGPKKVAVSAPST